MEQRLSLVTLGVDDIERSRRFYEALGWKGGGGEDGAPVFFQAGGIVLAIWSRAELAADSEVEDNGGWGGITLAQNVRSPEEVDSLIAEARQSGAEILRLPAPTFWGGYNAVFADPDGHRWEIAHNPHWTLTDDGATRIS